MNNKEKNLAIIVLNYNDYVTTIKYVNSISKFRIINRIIVVDNCSPDNSYEKLLPLKSSKIDVIKTDCNKGYSYGNNYGIYYLNKNYGFYKYICISNSDIIIDEPTIVKIIEFLDGNQKYAIATARMHDSNGNPHQLAGWRERYLKNDVIDSSRVLQILFNRAHPERYPDGYFSGKYSSVDCVPGSFFIIRNSVFKKVNYFDEGTFLYYEEDILAKKVRNLGYKLCVLNNCMYIHLESVSVDKVLNNEKKFNQMQISKKYYHKNYNPGLKNPFSRIKLVLIDVGTFFHNHDDEFENIYAKSRFVQFCVRLFKRLYFALKNGILVLLFKLLLLIINIILWPIFFLVKKLRKKEKVLYFSLVTWKWIKQRPHFVALYLSNNNYTVDYRYQTLFKKYMPDQNNMHVNNDVVFNKNFKIKPFRIFPAIGFKTKLNSIITIFRTSFWNYDKIIITHPNQMDFIFYFIMKIRGTKFYYECMDNYIGWEVNPEAFLEKEGRLVNVSNKIIVSSNKLKNKFITVHNINANKIQVIRNGFDKTLFDSYDNNFKTGFKHPNIVYIGTVDDWFDFESIEYFARKNKNFNVDIIGPINADLNKKIKSIKESNIIFHGPVEHSRVPNYIVDSTVLIIPFIINDIIEYVDPVKMYEYLYLKKPVVSSYWNELDQFKGLCYFYSGKEEFEKQVFSACENGLKFNKKYDQIMESSSWDNRLKEYINALK